MATMRMDQPLGEGMGGQESPRKAEHCASLENKSRSGTRKG